MSQTIVNEKIYTVDINHKPINFVDSMTIFHYKKVKDATFNTAA